MPQEPHDERDDTSRTRKSAGVDDWERPSSRMQRRERRQSVTLVLCASWIVFLIAWLWQYATRYDLWQNIGISLAGLVLTFGFIAILWTNITPSRTRWRVHVTILVSMLWIVSILVWYPFYSHLYGVYFNIAIGWASFVIVLLIYAVTWLSLGRDEMRIDVGHRPAVTIVLFVIWSIFIIYWLLFQGNPNYWEHDAAVGILSLIIVLVFISVTWIPWIRAQGEMNHIRGLGALFVWLSILFVWFGFFAMPYNFYQNLAVVIVTFIVILAMIIVIERVR